MGPFFYALYVVVSLTLFILVFHNLPTPCANYVPWMRILYHVPVPISPRTKKDKDMQY